MNRFAHARFSSSLTLLMFTANADAAFFCVGSATELKTALNVVGGTGLNDVTQIRIGIYTGSGIAGFGYTSNESFAITIDGGYLRGCTGRSKNPGATGVDGSVVRTALRSIGFSHSSGDLTFIELTLRGGVAVERSGGLHMGVGATYSGNFRVERVYFDDSQARLGGGAPLSTAGATLVFRNNLLRPNSTNLGAASAELNANTSASGATADLIGSNTFFTGHARVIASPEASFLRTQRISRCSTIGLRSTMATNSRFCTCRR